MESKYIASCSKPNTGRNYTVNKKKKSAGKHQCEFKTMIICLIVTVGVFNFFIFKKMNVYVSLEIIVLLLWFCLPLHFHTLY